MTDNENSNIEEIKTETSSDPSLEAYVEEALKKAREESKANSEESGYVEKFYSRDSAWCLLGQLLIFFVLALFMVSPLIQLFVRMYYANENRSIIYLSSDVRRYQWMVRNIHIIARMTAVFVYIWAAVMIVSKFRAKKKGEIEFDTKNGAKKLVPLFIFFAFAAAIYIVTKVRGHNEYDLTGHPYMYESIWSYMTYPTVYFFCGMMLFSKKWKRVIVYCLTVSALPLNILALINEWVKEIPYFTKNGMVAVFHNSNHYGYYILIVIIANALFYVYEKKPILKIFNLISMCVATMALVINNTLGAFLASFFVLAAHIVYWFIRSRKKYEEDENERKEAKKLMMYSVIAFASFMFIIIIMSFKYNTVFSSVLKLFTDVSDIVEDPLENDAAGSGRWRLWKGTAKYIVKKPVLGYGVEGLLNTHYIGTPHNELLQYAAFFGVPVMLLYLVACIIIIVRVLKTSKKSDKITLLCFCVSVGYLVSSLFGVCIYYTTPFVYIFLGMAYSEYAFS